MTAILTLTRYKGVYAFFALVAMAIFRPFLFLNKNFSFYRLLGCGKNGSFNLHPDWQQYGVFTLSDDNQWAGELKNGSYDAWKKKYYGIFITSWWRFFRAETWSIVLLPATAHGKWGGREIGNAKEVSVVAGPVAILTRASIRPLKAAAFWKNVPAVEREMLQAKGLLYAVGIGEMPLFRQATFSIWVDMESMKHFAYDNTKHKEVIRRTRDENWYSEELFARFIPLHSAGSLNGMNPFKID